MHVLHTFHELFDNIKTKRKKKAVTLEDGSPSVQQMDRHRMGAFVPTSCLILPRHHQWSHPICMQSYPYSTSFKLRWLNTVSPTFLQDIHFVLYITVWPQSLWTGLNYWQKKVREREETGWIRDNEWGKQMSLTGTSVQKSPCHGELTGQLGPCNHHFSMRGN